MATSAGRVELGQAIDPLVRPSSSVPQRVAEMSSMQRHAWSRANGRRLGGVAMDTFAYSLLGVNADQRAPTPCFTYTDSGCTARVAELRRQLDERMIQPRTGCRPHLAALRWLRDAMPDTFISVHHWMSLGEYIYLQILGVTVAGTSTAAWTGMVHRSVSGIRSCWIFAVRVELMSEVHGPDQPLASCPM
jgi:gluconokinase